MHGIPTNGEMVRSLRKRRAWTQEQLATVCDCSVRTIRSAERGRRLNVETLNQIAAVLEVPMTSLVNAPPVSKSDLQRRCDLIRDWHDCYLEQRVGRLLEMHHRETFLELPGTQGMPAGGDFHGIEQHIEHYEEAFQVFPIIEVKELPIDAVNDRVFARPTATLRSEATGQEFTLTHANVFKIFEGKIVHRITYMDLSTYRDTLNPKPRAPQNQDLDD